MDGDFILELWPQRDRQGTVVTDGSQRSARQPQPPYPVIAVPAALPRLFILRGFGTLIAVTTTGHNS